MTNVAVFGAGRIGRIHASNIAALPSVKLKYISDPVPAFAGELAGQLGAEVASIEAALADKNVDVVAICSSTDTHSDLITRAAAAGKHIFCEKPVDLSVPRAEACAQAVKDANVACMIGFNRRFDPTFSDAQRRMVAGEIGSPEMLIITQVHPLRNTSKLRAAFSAIC
jgi:myo-inositol 2-dehydrogenase / D-chiro-inositol 1-dehydrogenase